MWQYGGCFVVFYMPIITMALQPDVRCKWDVHYCEHDEILCTPEESIFLDTKESPPLPPQLKRNRMDHCFAINDNDKGDFESYEISVDMLSQQSSDGENSGNLGLIFNFEGPMDYDFVYLNIQNISSATLISGHRLNGKDYLSKETIVNGSFSGTKFHKLKLIIDHTSSKSTKMYLDNQFLGSFQEHFVSRLKGGVFVLSKQNAVALFKNFILTPCDNFNEEGQCTDLKDGCPDDALSDLNRGSDLIANGWITDCDYQNHDNYAAQCGTTTWYGWRSTIAAGTISATLKGTGEAVLSFGNCYQQGNVRASLNGRQIGWANAYQRVDITFDYSSGDILKFEELDYSIIKLYSIIFKCYQ